jgi:hypothetical protein
MTPRILPQRNVLDIIILTDITGIIIAGSIIEGIIITTTVVNLTIIVNGIHSTVPGPTTTTTWAETISTTIITIGTDTIVIITIGTDTIVTIILIEMAIPTIIIFITTIAPTPTIMPIHPG